MHPHLSNHALPARAGALVLALALATTHAGAQRADSVAAGAHPFPTMGQPPVWQPYAAALGAFDLADDSRGGSFLVGVHRSVLNPVGGLLGGSAEAYGNTGRVLPGVGVRALASSRVLALSAGADWNVTRRRVDFVLSYQTAVRRGGLFGHGTMLRVDWLPTRHRTLAVGVNVPLMQPFAGRTRPHASAARLPNQGPHAALSTSALPAGAEAALVSVAQASRLIDAYTSLYTPEEEAALRVAPRAADGRGYEAAMDAYDGGLERAFAIAAGNGAAGEDAARRARAGVLDAVIVPYDSLFGQPKRDGDDIRKLTSAAQGRFLLWLADSSRVPARAQAAVAAVHARWLEMLERVHADIRARWKDSRLVWLPLQLALTPEQYDEQTEVDSLIARVVGRPFSDQNALTYLASSDLPLEIARSIYAARDYHVLWVHDFTGRTATRAVDEIGYSMVADVYFPALTAAVQRYDSAGKLPLYLILLDQYWYEPRDGRLWMTMLEDPLGASVRLPGQNAAKEAHLRQRQAELRAAVAGSRRLQRDAARHGGERWLRQVVKVDVDITQPADFSFRSARIVPPIPFTPDNVMRDHRKLAFYDLNEADPYHGSLILMGVGIGEQYASTSWEDRGYRLRGPAALEARAAVRRLLEQNGFTADEIPAPLQVVKGAPADTTTVRRMNRGEYVGRALQVHNETGFGRKESSIARAMLYTLAPPGSILIVPDPLWLSPRWASMLAAAAARGSRVFVVAPSVDNAPSPQAPLMAMAHDVLLRLLELGQRLEPDMHAAGGELRVGIFTARAQVNDAEGRRREVREGLARAPWIRDVIPFDAKTLTVLDSATTTAAADGADATTMAPHEKKIPPQLHQKTQLIARPGAIAALVRQPGWDEILARAMRVQSRQSAKFAEQLRWTTPDVDTNAVRSNDALLREYEQALPAADRKRMTFYFSLGTQNEDPRGMLTDGEASVIVSGFHAAAGLVDLYFIMARSTWIDSRQELERYVPEHRGLMERLARAVRYVL